MTSYLRKRGKRFHFRKRIPSHFQKLFSKEEIQVPLETDSRVIAVQRASNFNLTLEDFWNTLSVEDSVDEAEQQFQQAVLKARLCGFQYISKEELVEKAPLSEFINRINAAHLTTDIGTKEAVLGSIEVPTILLSKAQKDYLAFEEGNLNGYSSDQIRKWKNPRNKAAKNFIQLIGDKPLDTITRKDILDFRAWWIDRIKQHGLSANSANKEFGFIRQIINSGNNNHALGIQVDALFREIRLKEADKTTRLPFSNTFIQEVLLNPDKLSGLNEEAWLLILAMTNTGARIKELVGLDDEHGDVVLDADIPHIRIRPNTIRGLKTPQSERDIPLIGASLCAFKKLNGGFDRYKGRSDLISNTINKYLRDNQLLPTDGHSLYSLRHSFEDRLTAVEPPDKVQAALMGHKYTRPRYGLGPTLEQKKSWLEKIAFLL